MSARSVTALALLALAAHGLRAGSVEQQTAAPPAAPAAAAVDPGARSPRIASYRIDARLDPASRTITGDEVLTWRNTSAQAAPTLQFHLYFNAWRNSSSTWMRERALARGADVARRPERDWGWIDLTSVRIGRRGGGEADLTSRVRFIAPDDGNADDRTVAEVPLDAPVQPGETLSIRIGWTSRVPRTFARTGAIGSYYFVAQWFPKIGVLEDSGWNCHQFHAATEFFADFGTYDVRLTVPGGWVLGATGTERERRDNPDGTTTHRYVQEDVHDFAWTTSPDYIVATETFTHATLPPVVMRLLLQPEHRGQEARHFAATRVALEHYGEWFGAYPYGHVTVVDPAWQSGADGMEYPTLFTGGTRWLAPRHALDPEGVVVHEAGHQFWYGIVATNEFEDAWMDEGINTFATSRVMGQAFAPTYAERRYFGGFIPWLFEDLPLSRETETLASAAYRPLARADTPATQAWRYWPGTARGAIYMKPVLWLHTLERMLGWETLQRILSTYFTRFAFKHPRPEDFFAVASEVSGQDLTWFFDQVHRSSNAFDYGIERFSSERAAARGYLGDGPARSFRAGTDDRGYRTSVLVRRYGEAIFPVDVRLALENGEEIRWRWDGRERWKLFEVTRPVRGHRADVDPDRVLLLDVNVTNNSALVTPVAHRAARKWSLAWLIWLQDHLLTYGFFV